MKHVDCPSCMCDLPKIPDLIFTCPQCGKELYYRKTGYRDMYCKDCGDQKKAIIKRVDKYD